MRKSNLTGYNYDNTLTCEIVNHKQQMCYMRNGVFPIDMYLSKDPKKDFKDIVVMVFNKDETRELYKKWMNYELE